MIVNSDEYYKLLSQIKDYNPPRIVPLHPDSIIMDIDLNTREIKSPQYLSVQDDHLAETVYFRIDRFYDNYDLANSIGIIQYIDATGKGHLYPIPYYDLYTEREDNKIIFPWCIEGFATNTAGVVTYAIKFYQLDKNNKLEYSLNTKSASSIVQKGININAIKDSEDYYQLSTIADQLISEVQNLKRDTDIFWIVLD